MRVHRSACMIDGYYFYKFLFFTKFSSFVATGGNSLLLSLADIRFLASKRKSNFTYDTTTPLGYNTFLSAYFFIFAGRNEWMAITTLCYWYDEHGAHFPRSYAQFHPFKYISLIFIHARRQTNKILWIIFFSSVQKKQEEHHSLTIQVCGQPPP